MNTEDRSDPAGAGERARPADAGFQEQYAAVAPALYAWAELRVRPSLRTRLEAQDLLQEVWLRGMKGFARFDPRSTTFRAWAFRIGKNVLLEAVRASRNEALVQAGWSASTGTLSLQGIPEDVTSFTQRLAREDSVRAFLEHASKLEETDRMLLVHCGLEGQTCAEAAVKLDLSLPAATKRWQRLKARLRESPWSRTFLDVREQSDAEDGGAASG